MALETDRPKYKSLANLGANFELRRIIKFVKTQFTGETNFLVVHKFRDCSVCVVLF